jgi:hypothetical protein
MPFRSKAQLRTCYGTHPKGWDCDKWLHETKNPDCLPERVGGSPKRSCRRSRSPTRRSPLRTGPRGGKYYLIGQTKVYVQS